MYLNTLELAKIKSFQLLCFQYIPIVTKTRKKTFIVKRHTGSANIHFKIQTKSLF